MLRGWVTVTVKESMQRCEDCYIFFLLIDLPLTYTQHNINIPSTLSYTTFFLQIIFAIFSIFLSLLPSLQSSMKCEYQPALSLTFRHARSGTHHAHRAHKGIPSWKVLSYMCAEYCMWACAKILGEGLHGTGANTWVGIIWGNCWAIPVKKNTKFQSILWRLFLGK